MSADLERLAAEFERFQARIKQAEQKFSGVGEMREQLAQLEAVAVSPDRSVRVTAGAGGAVTDLWLAPEATRLPATELAATIMATLRQAVAEAVRRQAGIVDDTFGLHTTDQVLRAQTEAFGADAEAAPPRREPSRPRPDDEDDFSQNSIY